MTSFILAGLGGFVIGYSAARFLKGPQCKFDEMEHLPLSGRV